MRSVLISIRPYWVFLIIAQIMGWNTRKRKTVEIRKNYPNTENWNRSVRIYCSKDKRSFSKIPKEYQPLMEPFLGKVIGEFVCKKMLAVSVREDAPDHFLEGVAGGSYLTAEELRKYAKKNNGYLNFFKWGISQLKVYDKPKELSEFIVASKLGCCNEGVCRGCPHFEKGNGISIEDDCLAGFDTDAYKPLRRPPQSWCYVEEPDNA